jgi:aminoglycoside phosphotransferase (APT) family kinase protein
MRRRERPDLVFCHNDLSANNVIVDPDSLKIKAIIDWEYAGFYPPEFEAPFYRRPGPSVALDGEVDDVDALTEMISKESE